ncbi:MAG: endonuclease MutS2 [Synergistetes bacterium]|nr:endonuclease MutS2 [Synergistota bacterium]MCX8127388.1 endonuclease MutS2 [Synergistota bacterium]MDW8192252.1 endonuclease MutS2 [Synergistota bacterium]
MEVGKRTIELLEFEEFKDILSKWAFTELGKKRILDKSILSREELERELYILKEAYVLLSSKETPPFSGGLVDLTPLLGNLKVSLKLLPEELLKIRDFCKGVEKLKEFFFNKREAFPGIYSVARELEPLRNLSSAISKAINDRGEIDSEATPLLSSLRRRIKALEEKIKNELLKLIHSPEFEDIIQEPIYTLREGRFVIPVKRDRKSSFPGIVHDLSGSGMTLFMEPLSTLSLQNELRELKSEEENEVNRILYSLGEMVMLHSLELKKNIDLVAKLDDLFARAAFMAEEGAVIPEIDKRPLLRLVDVRHPLLGKGAVPITIEVGRRFGILVITGPNTGGKTVALKTAGLMLLAGWCGFPIPAKEAIIGEFDLLFADIGDEQSIAQNLSTFSSHIGPISEVLPKITSRSLLLLDELGAGTDPQEGAALAMAILKYIKGKKAKAIITTHYPALKYYAIREEDVENASVEFDIETLRPTYRLFIGIPGASNAIAIARRLGMIEEVLEEASRLISYEDEKIEEVIRELHVKMSNCSLLESKLKEELKKAQELREKYEKKLETIREKEEKILASAKLKANRMLKDAERELKGILEDARADIRSYAEAKGKLKELSKEIGEEVAPLFEPLKSVTFLKVGDRVYVPKFGKWGEVEEIFPEEEEVALRMGYFRVFVSKDEISGEGISQLEESGIKEEVSYEIGDVPYEFSIRKKKFEEAKEELLRFLDRAFLKGYPQVKIVHGKGEGILRKMVWDLLKEIPYVKSFRFGEEAEGGQGVTVVCFERG